mgnify:CR=1 FL=1
MRKNFYLLIAASMMFASCGKLGKFTADNFTVTPTPLECAGGEVPVTVSANIPAKFMKKKAVVTCTPVLRWNGGESVGASATFQGEKVEGNNQVISYKNSIFAVINTRKHRYYTIAQAVGSAFVKSRSIEKNFIFISLFDFLFYKLYNKG